MLNDIEVLLRVKMEQNLVFQYMKDQNCMVV